MGLSVNKCIFIETKFMKKLLLVFLLCHHYANAQDKETINLTLNNWHKAACEANFDNYYDVLTDDAVYIGTDATEYWTKAAFKNFAKPYFDKGKAWCFSVLERHVYFSKDLKTAWFDELLNTQMKICRGSGVLIKIKNGWKIKQYVLSMTIPNESTASVIKIKSDIENPLIEKLKVK